MTDSYISTSGLEKADERVNRAREILRDIPPTETKLLDAATLVADAVVDLLEWSAQINRVLEVNGAIVQGDNGAVEPMPPFHG